VIIDKDALLWRKSMGVELHGVVQWISEHAIVLSVSRGRRLAKPRYHPIWYKVSVVETALI
jgi:hypothetical protein